MGRRPRGSPRGAAEWGIPRGGRGILLRRVHEATLAIFLAALLVSLGFQSWAISLGLAAGTAVATAILASWQFVVAKAFDARSPRKWIAAAVGLGKLPVLGAIVYVLIGRELVSAPAFAVGLGIPMLAVGLMSIGRMAEARKEDEELRNAAAPR